MPGLAIKTIKVDKRDEQKRLFRRVLSMCKLLVSRTFKLFIRGLAVNNATCYTVLNNVIESYEDI